MSSSSKAATREEPTSSSQSSVIVSIVIVRLSELVISFLSSCFQCLDLNWIALSIEVAGTAPVSSTLFSTSELLLLLLLRRCCVVWLRMYSQSVRLSVSFILTHFLRQLACHSMRHGHSKIGFFGLFSFNHFVISNTMPQAELMMTRCFSCVFCHVHL